METSVLYDRASLLHQQGRTEDAIRSLKELLQQDPDHADAYGLYARCLFDRQDFDQGLVMLQNAIAIEPNNSYFIYLQAFAAYRKDQHSLAEAKLREAISMEPWHAAYFGLLAIILIEEIRFQEGLDQADAGLAIDPENVTCLNARATALNKMRKTDLAIETMQEALNQDPENEYTHATIGWNYLEKGRHRDAATHFREALRIDPGYRNAQQGLKESLKSRIAPYRWLLRYSFWVNNQGKRAGWMAPLILYVAVRIIAAVTSKEDTLSVVGIAVVTLYLLFVITSWIINPVANFFLLFHRDGKYALTQDERWRAITVIASLVIGLVCLIPAFAAGSDESIGPWQILAGCFLLMAVPLNDVVYPLGLRHGSRNTIALLLIAIALVTVLLAFPLTDTALITGLLFVVLFILNNWLGLFRMIAKRK